MRHFFHSTFLEHRLCLYQAHGRMQKTGSSLCTWSGCHPTVGAQAEELLRRLGLSLPRPLHSPIPSTVQHLCGLAVTPVWEQEQVGGTVWEAPDTPKPVLPTLRSQAPGQGLVQKPRPHAVGDVTALLTSVPRWEHNRVWGTEMGGKACPRLLGKGALLFEIRNVMVSPHLAVKA